MKWHWGWLIILGLSLNNCSKNNSKPSLDVFGHAGTSLHRDRAIYPANSMESVKYALDVLDADGVEIDVQMTKDSILVLYHDAYLNQASTFNGCVSQYTYNEIKHLKLDYTNYEIVTLQEVLSYTQSRQKRVYIDVKTYDYCQSGKMNLTTFQYALNHSISSLDSNFIYSNIILGMTDYQFLNDIQFNNKCYETTNVNEGLQKVNDYEFNCLLLFNQFISKDDATQLNNTSIYWGIIGVKDKWLIDEAVERQPKFIISDNIARTKKVTE